MNIENTEVKDESMTKEENIEAKEEKKEIRNKVFARGRVLGIGKDSYGRPRFILYIRSNSSRPASYVSFSLEKIALGDIRTNDVIEVEGHMVAYQIRNRVWDRTSYTQYIVADSIRMCDTQLKQVFGYDGGFAYGRQYIKVCLAGKVESVVTREAAKPAGAAENAKPGSKSEWSTITIRVQENKKRPCSIKVQYSPRMRVNDVKCEKGDEVCLVATVNSRKIEKDGTTRYYENIVVDDIGIVSKAEEQDDLMFSGMDEMSTAEENA